MAAGRANPTPSDTVRTPSSKGAEVATYLHAGGHRYDPTRRVHRENSFRRIPSRRVARLVRCHLASALLNFGNRGYPHGRRNHPNAGWAVTGEAGIKALATIRENFSTDAEIWLCRCGHSKNKPYCDGSHEAAHFSGRQQRTGDGAVEFVGKEITVVDNFSPAPTRANASIARRGRFFTKGPGGRVSHPDASPSDQVIAAIRHCPSGALLYKLRGQLVDAYTGDTEVRVEKDGPLHVQQAKLGVRTGRRRKTTTPSAAAAPP